MDFRAGQMAEERIVMQSLIGWWCAFIGVTDPFSIQVATGVVAGGLVMTVVGLVVSGTLAIISRL